MANYYYEISDAVADRWDSKYYVVTARAGDVMRSEGWKFIRISYRIWCEDNDRVYYFKHRGGLPHETLVDMKEFMWVKLSSKVYNG